MQTFLPDPDFETSARLLDDRRLGKQRVEALQIVRALTWPTYGWKHHPVVRMWAGCEEALGAYGVAVCREWVGRGWADTCEEKILVDLAAAGVRTPPRSQRELAEAGELPTWLGDEALHASHRSALVLKDPERYAERFPDDPPGQAYVWPGGPAPGSGAAERPGAAEGRGAAEGPGTAEGPRATEDPEG